MHGFASTKEVNWVNPGWVRTLTGAGRRAIALDNRGHGQSSKLYDPAEYHSSKMAEDVRALLDHLGIERADVMGYSMGARIAAFLAVEHPERVRSIVLGGLGYPSGRGRRPAWKISPTRWRRRRWPPCRDETGRLFRSFAEQTKSDLRALAACIRGSRQTLSREQVAGHSRAGAGCGRHQRRCRGQCA